VRSAAGFGQSRSSAATAASSRSSESLVGRVTSRTAHWGAERTRDGAPGRLGGRRRGRRAAQAEADQRRAALGRVIAEADENGLPVTTIARFTGLDRKSVYKLLRQAGRR
jgi:hypothetical protein